LEGSAPRRGRADRMAVRALKCPTCGAPIKWKGSATVVECRYCRTHVTADSGVRTQAPANVVSQPKFPAGVMAIAAVAFLVVTGSAVAVFVGMASRATPGTMASGQATRAEVAAANLARTPEQLRDELGAKQSNRPGFVYVMLDDETFSQASFGWDSSHLEHVRLVTLNAARGKKIPPEVLERARAQLGRDLRASKTGGHQYGGYGVNFSISETSLHINAHEYEPGWKDKLGALWTVMKYAALGGQETLTEKTKRDVLNLGYPLERLGSVRIDVTVDGARTEVKRVIPGAHSKSEVHRVGIGHPWVARADLRWKNEAGGKLNSVNLFYPPEVDLKAQREDIELCLTPLLGAPKVTGTDHLAGKVTLRFEGKGGVPSIMVTGQYFGIQMQSWDAAPATQAGFAKLLETLSACGR
jgi:hypothetical protein